MPSPRGPRVDPGSLSASPARHLVYSAPTHVRTCLHLRGSCSHSQLHGPRAVFCQQRVSEGHPGNTPGRVGEGGIDQHLLLAFTFAKNFKSLPLAVPPPRAREGGGSPSPPSRIGEGRGNSLWGHSHGARGSMQCVPEPLFLSHRPRSPWPCMYPASALGRKNLESRFLKLECAQSWVEVSLSPGAGSEGK